MAADRLARFGAALAVLWAAHDLGDHVIQTDHQAGTKAHDGADGVRGMAGHLAGYHAAQVAGLALLRPLGLRPSLGRLTAAVAVSAVTHGFLDRRWPVVELLKRTGSERFAEAWIGTTPVHVQWQREGFTKPQPLPLHGPYLADQALHHGALVACALILAGGHRGS